MANLNRVLLIGRLTRDPELKYTPAGVPVCNFSIAVNRSFGKGEEKTADFFRIECWRGLAETCAKFLAKGRMVHISGRIQTRSYEAQDGTKRSAWEVVANEVQFIGKGGSPSREDSGERNESFDMDDMIPF
ncbi:MAG: single-stranded DNA-binding protein [Candidatus Wallbacteria bacterium HGW-Wallbacteria-1]|jgi:single-strand DNA-binding protein|uniref:Single-stranded DNA-binding protein n=1 Tax=Candidatus Wallbacteria bacterium HGW-Wallbacteria-1 TaxID=2013854 RepID=A0A2N1PUG9_9BACT|nr:MAG: single-stranded DNA-binding protein [Candidatus Wallbacteria bacterium HGW-Wallbacteria-1]